MIVGFKSFCAKALEITLPGSVMWRATPDPTMEGALSSPWMAVPDPVSEMIAPGHTMEMLWVILAADMAIGSPER